MIKYNIITLTKEGVIMSEISKAVSPEQVARSVSLIVSTLKWITTVVPGDTDDKIVAAVVKLTEEAWFISALTFLINKFEGDASKITADDFILAVKKVQGQA
jgi:hypothetical protein